MQHAYSAASRWQPADAAHMSDIYHWTIVHQERNRIIISKTPLRMSFAGGGTDIADYYRTGYGAVVSSAIRKYVYVTVNKRFDDDIRISYAKTEIVDSVDKIEHGLVREALRKVGIRNGIEITTIADIPSRGTGLGSSSAIAVGSSGSCCRAS